MNAMTKDLLQSLLIDRTSESPESLIVRCLIKRGLLSAGDIARFTGLGRSTVSTALAGLRQSEIVVEADPLPGTAKGVGRPATALALNPLAGSCVGIHIALEAVRVMVADTSHSVISQKIVELDRDYSPEHAAQLAKSMIAEAYFESGLATSGMLGVGIAVSGPLTPDGVVQRASGVPTWTGVNIGEAFGPVLEQAIFADNESNCAAIAEMTWGAARGHDDFVLFTIDLGVGGAVVQHGRVVTGIAGAAGEFGHISIDPGGDLCRCGNRGCLELYAGFNGPLEQISRVFCRKVGLGEAIAMAQAGDVGALRMIRDTAEMAGRGLGVIGSILNPPLIIIAGRLARAGDILLEPLTAAYERHTLIKTQDVAPDFRTRIVIGEHTNNSSLLGAVGLVLRHYGSVDPKRY